MKRIVWLSSFPKSGNTWVRFLLANYLQRENAGGIGVNELLLGTLASWRALFDEWSAVESSDLDDDEIFAKRADVFRHVARAARRTVYLKVHDSYRRRADGAVVFPEDVTATVIYIVRNPFDVAVSFAHHMNIHLSAAVDHMCDPEYILGRGPTRIGLPFPQAVGSWSGHVTSWAGSGLPLTVVRYEDLTADPAGELERMLGMAGEPVEPSRVARAVEFAAFSRLQAQERTSGFSGRRSRGGLFFRAGRIGDGLRELSTADRRRLIEHHSAVMRELGYLSPDGVPTSSAGNFENG